MNMTDEQKAKLIASLVREREMALAKGDDATVAAVGGELSRLGAEAAAPARRASKRPAPRRDVRRSEE